MNIINGMNNMDFVFLVCGLIFISCIVCLYLWDIKVKRKRRRRFLDEQIRLNEEMILAAKAMYETAERHRKEPY